MKIGLVSGDWVHPKNTPDGQERWGGSGWARQAQYLDLLPFEFVTGTLVWNKNCFVIRTKDDRYEFVPILLMHRLMHEGLVDHMKQARANGQVIINDIDDWYWGLDPSNQAFLATHPKHNKVENINNYRSILAASDLVTVSTPYLMSRLTWVKCPMVLVKNTVDLSKFTPHQHLSDTPTIGWAGSTAHRSRDLETVASVLRQLLDTGEYRLQHSGHHQAYPTFASRIGVRDSDVATMPLSDHNEYPNILNFDIGIVPLNVVPFNRAKSDIKGIEYAASGIPFVAQVIDAYQELKDSTGIGRLAKRPADWLKQITALKDPKVRQEEADRNLEAVKVRDIQYGAAAMAQILSSFM